MKRQVSSSSEFSLFFSVITHNSSVNFSLMHFLLCAKGSNQRPILTLPSVMMKICAKVLMSFPNHKPVFLQILHDSSVSWKITHLYFFSSKVIYFARKGPIKVQIFETFECLDQNSQNSCHFWNNKSVFLQMLHHFSVSWCITPLYFFSWNFMYFQQKEPIKVQIWWNLTWTGQKSEILHLMGSFCPNYIKF